MQGVDHWPRWGRAVPTCSTEAAAAAASAAAGGGGPSWLPSPALPDACQRVRLQFGWKGPALAAY